MIRPIAQLLFIFICFGATFGQTPVAAESKANQQVAQLISLIKDGCASSGGVYKEKEEVKSSNIIKNIESKSSVIGEESSVKSKESIYEGLQKVMKEDQHLDNANYRKCFSDVISHFLGENYTIDEQGNLAKVIKVSDFEVGFIPFINFNKNNDTDKKSETDGFAFRITYKSSLNIDYFLELGIVDWVEIRTYETLPGTHIPYTENNDYGYAIGGLKWFIFAGNVLRPYVGMGAGVTDDSADNDDENEFTYSIFGGVDWYISNNLSVLGELRYSEITMNEKHHKFEPFGDSKVDDVKQDYSVISLLVGLSWRFDKF